MRLRAKVFAGLAATNLVVFGVLAAFVARASAGEAERRQAYRREVVGSVNVLAGTLAGMLREEGHGEPLAVLGGDTRESTPELCSWLAAGLVGAGGRVRSAGVRASRAWMTSAAESTRLAAANCATGGCAS